jgi:type III pantothenate kinase
MPNLVIDRGNHATKACIFSGEKITAQGSFTAEQENELLAFIRNQSAGAAILCSVQESDEILLNELKTKPTFIRFTYKTPTPLKLSYATPETLGPDRIAAALAGWQLSGGGNVLTVVAGTCITYNIVEASGAFAGGAISPGLNMRLKAMH